MYLNPILIMQTLALAVMLASLAFLLYNLWSCQSLMAPTDESRKIVLPQRRRRKTRVGSPSLLACQSFPITCQRCRGI